MKLVDYKCVVCGNIVEGDMDEYSNEKKCGLCLITGRGIDNVMVRMFGSFKFRIIKYSPEYKGGNDKNLSNQPKELMERK